MICCALKPPRHPISRTKGNVVNRGPHADRWKELCFIAAAAGLNSSISCGILPLDASGQRVRQSRTGREFSVRTITKQDCRVIAAAVKPSQLGPTGREIYSRLFQEAYGVPFDMVQLLRKGPQSISALEKKLKMSRRTVFRYLLALEKTGCAVELQPEGYRITKLGKGLGTLIK
jgi:biotin operon repressor